MIARYQKSRIVKIENSRWDGIGHDKAGAFDPVSPAHSFEETRGELRLNNSSTVTLTIQAGQLDPAGIATPTIHLETGNSDIYGINFTLLYSSAQVTATDVLAGPLADNWWIASNRTIPGQIKIGLAGALPITQTGLLLEIPFRVYNPANGNSAIFWQNVQINEGAITANAIDGLVVARDTEWHTIYLPLVLNFGGQ